MNKAKKKGFTIVELVIVIAVIAILAAVLIPTFAGLINKANVSKDTQLVRNLNTALAADTEKHTTMQSALDAAADFGYDVAKINTSATGNEIMWDSKNDCFVYLNNGVVEYIPNTKTEEVKNYDLWKIVSAPSDGGEYSVYLDNPSYSGAITIRAGFDTNATGITEVNYESEAAEGKTVTIRTKGGKLTVNAPKDTIYHYGASDELEIIACAEHSYHEWGVVEGTATIGNGRVVIESGAELNAVIVNGQSSTVVEITDGSNIFGEITVENANIKISANAVLALPIVAKGSAKVENNNANVSVFADETVVVEGVEAITKEEVTTAEKLKQAFAKEKVYIELGADITLAASDFNSNVGCYLYQGSYSAETYLDLNGHFIKDPNYDAFTYTDANNKGQQLFGTYGSITIDDTSAEKTGAIYATRNLIRTEGNNETETTSHIKNGTFVTKSYTGGTCLYLSTTHVIIDNCNVYATNFGVYVGSNNNTEDFIINGGTIVGTANNNTKVSGAYAYAIAIDGAKNIINNVNVYGIQGALSVNSGVTEVNGGYYEASGKAYDLYKEATGFDAMAAYCKSETVTDSMVFYGGYFAGETSTVSLTVNGGEFVSSAKVAVHVGNSADGGVGATARTIINGGKFTGKGDSIHVDTSKPEYGLGIISLRGGEFNYDESELVTESDSYECVQVGDVYIVRHK